MSNIKPVIDSSDVVQVFWAHSISPEYKQYKLH